MNLALYISRRYLFSKKSHNVINIISAISVCGVAVGTLALVCVLSVFNGFGSLIENLFSAFDPDLKIILVEGKSFSVQQKEIASLRQNPNVICFSEVLQENAMLRFGERQTPALVKGVSDDFARMVDLKRLILNGEFLLKDNAFNYAVPGIGLAAKLGVAPYFNQPIYIYAPRRMERVNLSRPEESFTLDYVFCSAVFAVQQDEYDSKVILIPIQLARELFQYDSTFVTSVELKISDKVDFNKVKQEIQTSLGSNFKVLDRYEQQEDYFKIMKIEKWITYLILSFILLIAVFNVIGSLSMLIIDKKDDIQTLRNMGADEQLIRRIFLFEGWLISALGALVGIILGSLICILQEQFGFISLPGGVNAIVTAYPVHLEMLDVLLVFVTVLIMGFFAAWYPASKIKIEN